MAGYDFSGVRRKSRTINEYCVQMSYSAVVLYFNQFRSWLTPPPPAQSMETPISIIVRKSNGSERKIGQINPGEFMVFSFPIETTDDDDAIGISPGPTPGP